MIEIEIPGYKTLKIVHLVLDFNGTLAFDGALIDGVKASLGELSQMLTVRQENALNVYFHPIGCRTIFLRFPAGNTAIKRRIHMTPYHGVGKLSHKDRAIFGHRAQGYPSMETPVKD